MKAVSNIQRITKTMQMIATARFQAMQRRATEAQAYTRRIGEVVGELAASLRGAGGGGAEEGGISHPLLSPPVDRGMEAAGHELLLTITSNRGLCGGYNANVLRRAMVHLRGRGETGGANTAVEVVGKKGIAYFRFNEVEVDHAHQQFGDQPGYEEVERLAERYMAEFEAGRVDAVRVCYMHFETMGRQTPEVLQLLPLPRPGEGEGGEGGGEGEAAGGGDRAQYDFMPDPRTLLDELLPITVKTRLFQCFNEAVVSEQIARMVAMKAATDAAGKMRKQLNRDFNRARQTAITTELSEIIGGTAALA